MFSQPDFETDEDEIPSEGEAQDLDRVLTMGDSPIGTPRGSKPIDMKISPRGSGPLEKSP